MANKDRGEVTLQAGDVTHTIRFTINSLCNLEEELQMSITEIGGKLGDIKKIRIGLLRTILKHGLVGDYSVDQVGDIIGVVGLPNVMAAIGASLVQSFPTVEAKAADKNPK